MPRLVDIDPVEKNILNFINAFSQYSNYLPSQKVVTLLLDNLESPSPKDALCKVWLKLAHRLWSRRFFFNAFCYILIISPRKRARSFTLFEQTWVHFTKGSFVPGLVEMGSVLLEEKIFKFCQYSLWSLNFVNIFSQFANISPFEKRHGPSFEQTWIPFTQECFVTMLLKLT